MPSRSPRKNSPSGNRFFSAEQDYKGETDFGIKDFEDSNIPEYLCSASIPNSLQYEF